MRVCAGCAQQDDHPRHVVGVRAGSVPPDPWHFDCHAEAGCETCTNTVAEAEGRTGPALIEFLASQRNG